MIATGLTIEADPVSRSRSVFHFEDEGGERGRIIIEHVQDVEPIMERCKAIRGLERPHASKQFMLPVASIPLEIWSDLQRKWNSLGLSWEERQAELKRFLNDPDNSIWKYDPSFKL